MFVHRNQHEPEPSHETLNTFNSSTKQRITISRTAFTGSIVARNVIRELLLVDCGLYKPMSIRIGEENSPQYQAFSTIMQNCSTYSEFGGFTLFMSVYNTLSVGLFSFSQSHFHSLGMQSHGTEGLVGFHFDNCKFSGINDQGLSLHDVALVTIKNSEFRLQDDAMCMEGEGCMIKVTGLKQLPELHVFLSLLIPSCDPAVDFWGLCVTVVMENSVFEGSSGSVGGAVYIQAIPLTIKNCVFSLRENSEPAPIGGFLFAKTYPLYMKNVTFDASNSLIQTSIVSIMDTRTDNIEFEGINLLCPTSYSVHFSHVPYMTDKYSCQKQCMKDEYTFQAGHMVFLHAIFNYWNNSVSLVSQHTNPNCSACPVGAQCDKHIQALPNYWGYKDHNDLVHMVRCPKGYCCQDNDTCRKIDSCNEHRTGSLCGMCETNWTESLFSSECISVDGCPTSPITVLYIVCAAAYSFGLLVFNYLKDVAPSVFKKMVERMKRQLQHRQSQLKEEKFESQSQTSEEKEVTEDKKEDVMKYVQILFYYVQDAALFKVHLPDHSNEDNNIVVKILTFSPEIITTLYTNLSELCFSPWATAVTKLLFSSLFGHCSMMFLFLIFLGQACSSRLVSKNLKMLRARLVQTFLLVVLFSYQQQVIGAFALVQCKTLGSKKVFVSAG